MLGLVRTVFGTRAGPRAWLAGFAVLLLCPALPDTARAGQDSASFMYAAAEAAAPAGKAAAAESVPKGIRLFGTVEFRGKLKNMPKWERVVNAEAKAPTFDKDLSGVMRPAVYEQWTNLQAKMKGATVLEKARAVNVFFNRWPYRTDQQVYGMEDYWATPMEFMKKSGDCEDYSITKYYALRKLGVPEDSMRIVALMDRIRNIAHAVLVVYDGGNAYVLDNLTDMVLPHERFKQYDPQYSVNETYRWAHVKPTKKK